MSEIKMSSPEQTSLHFDVCGSEQRAELKRRGFTLRTLWHAGGAALLIAPALVIFYFCAVSIFFGNFSLQGCLFGLGIGSLLLVYGFLLSIDAFRNAVYDIELRIFNGTLSVTRLGTLADQPTIVSLASVIEIEVSRVPQTLTKTGIWVRLPTLDFPPLNRLLQNKDVRRHTLMSYVLAIITDRPLQEMELLEQWIRVNISNAKRNRDGSGYAG